MFVLSWDIMKLIGGVEQHPAMVEIRIRERKEQGCRARRRELAIKWYAVPRVRCYRWREFKPLALEPDGVDR